MTIHNPDISALFNRMADLLEIEGANLFGIRACWWAGVCALNTCSWGGRGRLFVR